EAVPPHLPVALDPDLRLSQLPDLGEGSETADRVEHKRHLDARLGTVAQRVDKAIRDFTLLENVTLEVDGFLRGADGVDHRRVERRAVGQNLDLVASIDRR